MNCGKGVVETRGQRKRAREVKVKKEEERWWSEGQRPRGRSQGEASDRVVVGRLSEGTLPGGVEKKMGFKVN